MYPLDAPGMPPPGPDFLYHANQIAGAQAPAFYAKRKKKGVTEVTYAYTQALVDLYRRALREPGFTMPVEVRNKVRKPATFVPGHIWGQHCNAHVASFSARCQFTPVNGPHVTELIVIGKMPRRDETTEGRNLVGDSGQILLDLLKRCHVPRVESFYVTNLVKFMPPDDSNNLRKSWVTDCLPLLHQELRIVRPKYILCLGADASKALLGSHFGVNYMEGRVVDFRFLINADASTPAEWHQAAVMTVLHPAMVAREPPLGRTLERGLGRFALLQSGVRFDREERGLDHRVVTTREEAEDVLAEADCWLRD